MAAKIYVAFSVFQGVIDDVRAYRSNAGAERFVTRFEKSQDIKSEQERKHQREYKDTYATWYQCELEE